MAAATRVKARFTTSVGESRIRRGTVTEDVIAGDLLILGATGWSKFDDDDATKQLGFAVQDYKSGDAHCSIVLQGAMAGWSGLTAGDPIYPSTSVAGGLDTTPLTIELTDDNTDVVLVPLAARIHAVSATEIEFSL